MNDPLLILLLYVRIYSEPPFISENIAEVSKVDYSSNAKSCNVLEYGRTVLEYTILDRAEVQLHAMAMRGNSRNLRNAKRRCLAAALASVSVQVL